MVVAKGRVMVTTPTGAWLQGCSLEEGNVEGQRAGLVSAGVEPRSEQAQAEPGANMDWCRHHPNMLLVACLVPKPSSAGLE